MLGWCIARPDWLDAMQGIKQWQGGPLGSQWQGPAAPLGL